MASPSMSTESASKAVELASTPAVHSARNMATLIQSTTRSTRRWRAGTSALTSQQSFTRPVYTEYSPPGRSEHEPLGSGRSLRDHADHAGHAAAEAGPGARRADPEDPRGRRVCAERRQHAALALHGGQASADQAAGAGLLQARLR